MAKISFKFEEKFITYLKSIGARWDPQAKVWAVPEGSVSEVEAKAKELNVQKLKIDRKQAAADQAPKPVEGVIRMRKSKEMPAIITAWVMAIGMSPLSFEL